MIQGFLKLQRTEASEDLFRHFPNAFRLLTWIAWRARRSDCEVTGLKTGQAFIGDLDFIGISEQSYRTAKSLLQKLNFATFQPTSKGTIATICDSRVFDCNLVMDNDQINGQLTSKQRAGNEQVTTNKKERRKEGEERKESTASPPIPEVLPSCLQTDAFRLAMSEWEIHKKQKKATLTPLARKKLINRLEAMGHGRAIAAIDYSITQGWLGVYEESGGVNRPQPATPKPPTTPQPKPRNIRQEHGDLRAKLWGHNGQYETASDQDKLAYAELQAQQHELERLLRHPGQSAPNSNGLPAV